jgi:hypothetical protein
LEWALRNNAALQNPMGIFSLFSEGEEILTPIEEETELGSQ